jgi:hypothetical protein
MRRGPITVQSVRYNRNGMAGDGFFVVAFTLSDTALLAVLFTGDEALTAGRDIHGTPIVKADMAQCAIVDPANPGTMHAYESFAPWLAEAIDRWVADGRAFRDAA